MSTFLLEQIGQRLWGFKPRLMAHFVEHHGPVRALLWFCRNMPGYEKILKFRGPIRTHLISTTASLINGCPYCTFGHAYAFQLHYFQNSGRLFPLSDEELLALSALPRDQILQKLTAALTEANLSEEIPVVMRTSELMLSIDNGDSANSTEEHDENILHLINMFAKLNACGIKDSVEPDEAHDPINKNNELKARYASSRAGKSNSQQLN